MQQLKTFPDIHPVNEQEEVSFASIVYYYMDQWKLFLISAGICLSIALIYILSTTSEYKVSSSVVIKDSKKGQSGFDITAFDDFKILNQSENVDNEMEVLRSKSLMQSAIDSLGVNVVYYSKKGLWKTELYRETPVKVKVKEIKKTGNFVISKNKQNELFIEGKSEHFSKKIDPESLFESPWGWLVVSLLPGNEENFPIHISLLSPDDYPEVSAKLLNKNSSAVELSMMTSCPEKGIDIINKLVEIYNQQVVEDKDFAAGNTLQFINNRLLSITNDLKYAEKEVESYKRTNSLTSPEAEANVYLTANTEYEKKTSDIELQIKILNSIRDYLNTQENNNNLVPVNAGLTDPTIIRTISTYNELVIEKRNDMSGMKETDPRVLEWERNMVSMKNTLLKGIELAENSLQQTKTELTKQGLLYSDKIKTLSTQEREARELYRQKEIKETLFLYLTQKKVETELALELTTPIAKVIDGARSEKDPVKPPKILILFSALVLGLIMAFLYLFFKDLLRDKLHYKEELIRQLKIPFLGEIPVSNDKSPFPALQTRSDVAEKFRMVVSNLPLITTNSGNKKVIAVTSTVDGEGKSFFSGNLALSLAGSGYKTLLINLNMRTPGTNDSVLSASGKGIVAYLANPHTKVNEIIDTTKKWHENLDIIPVKELPANPAALMASDRLAQLFNEIAPHYDYIIVDTPPASLIADVYSIDRFTDACIYVVRAKYTHKKSIAFIQELYKNNKLRNMTCILNGVTHSDYHGNEYAKNAAYYFSKN